jgi:arylsulfatase A-like enzyme
MDRLSQRGIAWILVFCLFVCASANVTLAAGAEAGRPNIVFVQIDDMGWRDIHALGSDFYETPNVDKLASQGMRFTHAYTAGCVCSPTRASLLTGKYPVRIPITDYIAGARKGKLIPADYLKALPEKTVTVAKALHDAGYYTGYFGKWHLGHEPNLPEMFGFDLNVGGFGAGSPPSYFSPYKNPKLPDGPPGEYLTDRLTDEAIKFIDTAKQKKQPFLLYLAHYAVHNPQQAKKEMIAHYEQILATRGARPATEPKFVKDHNSMVRQYQDHAVYAANVQSTDESVGRLMKKLDDEKLADNTIFIFTSDNGGLSTAEGAPTSNTPLRCGKGWLYEGGIRVPLIVRWPGVVKAASTCDVPVTSPDFFPTWLEAAGLPLMPETHPDGVSFLPLLKGGAAPQRDAMFWHYPHYGNQGGQPASAVRVGQWKLIQFFEDNHFELYDLSKDEVEKNDLSAKMPDKVAELKKKLEDWQKSVGAKFPTPNPDWDPNAPAEKPKKNAGKKKEAALLNDEP